MPCVLLQRGTSRADIQRPKEKLLAVGIAQLQRARGLLWQCNGGRKRTVIEKGKPAFKLQVYKLTRRVLTAGKERQLSQLADSAAAEVPIEKVIPICATSCAHIPLILVRLSIQPSRPVFADWLT